MSKLQDLGYDKNLYRGYSSPDDLVPVSGSSFAIASGTGTDAPTVSSPITQSTAAPSILSGSIDEILFSKKTSFTDTTNGWRQGLDQGVFKWVIGSSASSIDWNVTTPNTLTIAGGALSITSGTIAGLTISATALTATAGGNTTIVSSGATAFTAGPTGAPTFTVTQAGVLTASGAVISGSITATTGTIGGWTIGATTLTGGNATLDSAGKLTLGTGNNIVILDANDATYRLAIGNATYASAPFRVDKAGAVTATNITATGTINATGGYIGSTTALVYEAQGINTGTTGHIRGGQTDFNTGTGYFLGYSGGAYKLSIGMGGATSNNLTWDGTNLTVNGYVVSSKGSFGGDGSDGALTVTSGTTTIDLGGNSVVVKQYSSISITGTGKVNFTNPHANGTTIYLKSKGDITITSSTVPCLDASGMGAAGGTGGTGGTNNANGTNGTDGSNPTRFILDVDVHYGTKGTGGGANPGGVGGTTGVIYNTTTKPFYLIEFSERFYRKTINVTPGAGGGGGGGGGSQIGDGAASHGGNGGNGGNGGAALIIECGGAWNFTTTGGISVAGANGANGTNTTGSNTDACSAGGGGGGGAHGMCVAMYNTLTANTGTLTVTGGAGGTGGNKPTTAFDTVVIAYGGAGGAGAAGYSGAGGGGASGNVAGTGNAGTNAASTGAGGGGGAGAGSDGANHMLYNGGAGGTAGATVGGIVIQNTIYT